MASTGNMCAAKRKDGKPCQAFAVEGSRFCFWHEPGLARERAAARSRGGRARHNRTLDGDGGTVVLQDVGDVCRLLERVAGDLFALETSVARARAVVYVCSVAIKAFEVGELEERLDALEEKVFGG